MAKTDWGYGEGKAPKWRERERIPMTTGTRKLSNEQVLDIRRRYKAAGGSKQGQKGQGVYRELSEEYGISESTIQGIVKRRTYTDIGGY